YLVNGRPATPDVEEATALRDAGGRISDALRLIEPVEMIVEDAYEKVYPGESDPIILPKHYAEWRKNEDGTWTGFVHSPAGSEGEHLPGDSAGDEQAALEQWVANFLLRHWGMPWTKKFADLYQLTADAKNLGLAPLPGANALPGF